VLLVVLGVALYAVTMTLQAGRDEGTGGAPFHGTTPAASPQAQASAEVQAQAPAPEPARIEQPSPPPVVATQPPRPPAAAPPLKPQAATPPNVSLPPSVPSAAPPVPAASPATGGIGSPYRLVARTTEATWMRVRTEDGRTSEETIPANEVREWVSNGPFVLTIGNAGGVSLELNGRPVPRLGSSGAVIGRMVLPADVQ
jgi:cytoskeleton protein RodZ